MKQKILIMTLIVIMLLSGCSDDVTSPISIKPEDRGPDIEPTSITYDWMAGECPFSSIRVGRVRRSLTRVAHTISPNGIYFIENANSASSFIVYSDHGSDTFVKLCARVDCTHDNADCNAYLYYGSNLTFYRGYLYAVVGGSVMEDERCELIRMEPDGSDRVTVLDLNEFAQDKGAETSKYVTFFDGNCLFSTFVWESTGIVDGVENFGLKAVKMYRYKLDGSMAEPVERNVGPSYYSGDMLYCIGPAQNAENINGIWTCDIESDTETYVVDQLGIPGLYMLTEAYYFKDGAIRHLEYSTMEETVVVETGLEHDHLLFTFPDCLVLADQSAGEDKDSNLYIYNWAFDLVDTVTLTYDFNGRTQFMLISETTDKLFLTDSLDAEAMPKYYIDKAELGTGNATIHEFKYA